MNIFDLQATISLNTDGFMSGVGQAQSAMNSLAGGTDTKSVAIGTAIGNMATQAAGALVDFGKEAMQTGMSFDASMANVAAISGATAEEMDALRAKAKEMGASTKFTATEAADAFSYMAMAGWDASQMMDGIAGIMNLAAASGEDLATTSDIVTDALTAFGLKAEDSGHFADVLAAASSAANTNVRMMGETFKYVAPVAGALGYKAEDVATAIGTMANSGIKAGQAGTVLRASISRLVNPTKEVSGALNRLGLIKLADDTGEFAYNMDELEKEVSAVNKAQDAYNKALEKYGEGSTQAGTKAQKLAEAQAKLSSAMEKQKENALSYNAALLDADGNTLAFSETVSMLREAFSGLTDAQQAEYASVLFGQEAMSGMLAIINATDEDISSLSETIYQASLDMGSIAEAVQNSGVNWDQYADKMGSVDALIGDMAVHFTEAGDNAEELIGYLMQDYGMSFEDATAAVEAFQEAMAESNGTAAEMADIMNSTLPGSITLMQSAFDAVKTAIYEKFSEPLKEAVHTATDILSDLAAAIETDGIAGAFSQLGDIIRDNLGSRLDDLRERFPILTGAIQDFMAAFSGETSTSDIDSFAGAIGSMLAKFEENKPAIINSIKGAFDEFLKGLQGGKVGEVLSDASKFLAEVFGKFTDDLPGMIDRTRDSISDFFKALNKSSGERTGSTAESLGRIAGALIDIGGVMFDTLSPQVGEFIDVISGAKSDGDIETIAGGVASILGTIVSTSAEIIADVTEELANFFSKCAEEGLSDRMKPVVNEVVRLFDQFSEGLAKSIDTVTSSFFGFIDGAVEKSHMSQALGGLSTALGKLLSHFDFSVSSKIDSVNEAIGGFFSTIGGWAVDTFLTPWVVGLQKFIEVLETLARKAEIAAQKLRDFFSVGNPFEKISIENTNTGEVFGLGDVASAAWDATKKIGGAIKDGLASAADGMWDFMTSGLDDQVSAVENKLGINSPSKVFAGIGKNIVLGLEKGWGAEFGGLESQVDRDVKRLTDTARIGFEDSAIGRSSAAGISSMFAASEGGGRGDPVSINLVLDGDVAATALYDPLRRTAFQRGQNNMEAAYA